MQLQPHSYITSRVHILQFPPSKIKDSVHSLLGLLILFEHLKVGGTSPGTGASRVSAFVLVLESALSGKTTALTLN